MCEGGFSSVFVCVCISSRNDRSNWPYIKTRARCLVAAGLGVLLSIGSLYGGGLV